MDMQTACRCYIEVDFTKLLHKIIVYKVVVVNCRREYMCEKYIVASYSVIKLLS